jgi:ribosomal protein S18 acetylase RimI-like enzyme
VELIERLPTAQEYIELLRSVGWASPSAEECHQALEGSVAAVCAIDGGVVVGMGRLIGDGAVYCFAVDVVVDPRHQGRGTGRAMMARLEALAVARCLGARVDLVAAPDVVSFYRRLGYERLHSELMRKPLPQSRNSS